MTTTGRHAKVGRGRLVAIVLLDLVIVAGVVVFVVMAAKLVRSVA